MAFKISKSLIEEIEHKVLIGDLVSTASNLGLTNKYREASEPMKILLAFIGSIFQLLSIP